MKRCEQRMGILHEFEKIKSTLINKTMFAPKATNSHIPPGE